MNVLKEACTPRASVFDATRRDTVLDLGDLDVERHGEFRSGVYQEFARGFGEREYQPLLASGQANRTRLKNASEFLRKDLGGEGCAASLTRNILFAVYRVADSGEAREGLRRLHDEV